MTTRSLCVTCLCIWVLLPSTTSFSFFQRQHPWFQTRTERLVQLHAKRSHKRYNTKKPFHFANIESVIQERVNAGVNGTDVVLLVDANNVRGMDGFKLTTFDLIRSLASWRLAVGMKHDSIICVIDHGSRSNAFSLDGITLVFAGPNRTADDVIAHDCQWLVQEECKPHVFIATSDRELRSRCLRANKYSQNKKSHPRMERKQSGGGVEVFGSLHMSNTLRKHCADMTNVLSTLPADKREILDDLLKIETDVRTYSWPVEKNRRERRRWNRGMKQSRDTTSSPDGNMMENDECQATAVDWKLTALNRKDFAEKTWHRVLIAEHLRDLLEAKDSWRDKAFKLDTGVFNGALGRYHALHNRFTGSLVSLFHDHRIRNNWHSQDALRRYLNQTKESNETPELGGVGFQPYEFRQQEPSVVSNVTAASIMRKILKEGTHETQYGIITRFSAEAPAHLQLRRSRDVRKLLKQVATKERRAPDFMPRWYLLPQEQTIES